MAQIGERGERILAVAAGSDAMQLDLSAAQGYLLSRIDGVTSWRLLREIGGIPASDVDDCLERWLEQGLLDVVAGRSASWSVDAAEFVGPVPAVIDESALDEGLDIDLDVQRRILEFEASLARPYDELLGVAKGSGPKAVKRAYFKLSKEFHPDRYFRKQIGSYTGRLDRIFKKVLEAHEILSDPELCKVGNHAKGADATPTELSTGASDVAQESVSPAKLRPLTKLERLKQRMPFKISREAIAVRRARADEIFRAAQLSEQAGRIQEAEASIRIAISFDPSRAEFKEALGSLRIAAAGERPRKLLEKPSERMSEAELVEAHRFLEDVLPYRPHDPELNERAARVCLQLGRLEDGKEYAETLLFRYPESVSAHTLLGRIHKERGDLDRAVQAFEMALKFDDEDLEARRALAAVRIGARDSARGGES